MEAILISLAGVIGMIIGIPLFWHLIIVPLRWVRQGGMGTPSQWFWTGVGWLALTIWSAQVIYHSHSLFLLYQTIAAFTGTMTIILIMPGKWTRPHSLASTRAGRFLCFTPSGVLLVLITTLLVDSALSQSMYYAARYQDIDTVRVLRLSGGSLPGAAYQWDDLASAIRYHRPLEMDCFLAAGQDPDAVPPSWAEDRQYSLLMMAVTHNDEPIVASLLAHGANPNRMIKSETALRIAETNKPYNPHIVQLLIRAGAKRL